MQRLKKNTFFEGLRIEKTKKNTKRYIALYSNVLWVRPFLILIKNSKVSGVLHYIIANLQTSVLKLWE